MGLFGKKKKPQEPQNPMDGIGREFAEAIWSNDAKPESEKREGVDIMTDILRKRKIIK